MLSEEYRVSPDYKKFSGPVTAAAKASDSTSGPGVRNRSQGIDSIVDHAVRGGSERQSRY